MSLHINVLTSKDFTKYIKSIKQNDKNEDFFNNLIQIINPYFNEIVSKINQQHDEPENNTKEIKEIKKILETLVSLCDTKESLELMKQSFQKGFSFNNNFNDFYNVIVNFENEINGFNFELFNYLINNNTEKISLSGFYDLLTGDEIYDFVMSEKIKYAKSSPTLEKILVEALSVDLPSIKLEISGRVYAYIKSGYADADLFDKTTWLESSVAKNLYDVLLDIKNNPDHTLLNSEKIERHTNLAHLFTDRLNEICLAVVYDRKNQTAHIENAKLSPIHVNGKGESDLVIPFYHNPEKLLSIYCTTNPELFFTNNNKESWSVLSHQKINNHIVGKKMNELWVGNTKNTLHKDLLNSTLNDIEVINISPSILKNADFKNIFEITTFLPEEEAVIANFPILAMIMTYKTTDDKNSSVLSSKEYLNITQNVLLASNKFETPSLWENVVKNIKEFDEQDREKYFFTTFLIPYVEKINNIIQSKKIKKDYPIRLNSTSAEGKALFFVKEFPNLLASIGLKLINLDISTEDKNKYFKVVKDVLNHDNFTSEKSKEVLGLQLSALKGILNTSSSNKNNKKIGIKNV